ncbi:putative ABC exporter domain-containing protein [Clostridium sp. YIM B02551]|uniref:putative ABC exporter domain-containing protein n=1 Tax=Clostridium sp. YIM B02551 TaxID=2910679 RepID=UPI001EEB5E1E|nr:putative ABC exporter domain-containing protein [Clostridium sp. YIM B02551]
MKALIYLLRKSLINFILDLRKKPSKLIPMIIIVGFLIFTFVVSAKGGSRNIPSNISAKYIVAFGTIGLIGILLLALINGLNKRSSHFYMSDVNFAFTAPIRPQNMLIYEFVKSISSTLFFMVFLLYQIPNLRVNLGITGAGIVGLLVTIGLFFITVTVISIFLYSLCSIYPSLKNILSYLFKGIAVAIVLFTGIKILPDKSKALEIVVGIYNNDIINYIPLVGWYKGMIYESIVGINSIFFVYLTLNILLIGVVLTILYYIKLDYYEDVLDDAQLKEDALKLKTKQINAKEFQYGRKGKRKIRKISSEYTASYGKAIFYRHLLEYRKTGFGVVNLYTGFMVICAFIFGKFMHVGEITPLLYFYAYLSAISSFGTKIHTEMSKPYIFLIPDTQESKVFWATLASSFKFLVDGTLSFLLAGVLLLTNPIEIVLCIAVYVSFGFVFIYGGVLNYRLFGSLASNSLKGILMMVSIFVYILPGIIAAVVISSTLNFLGHYAIYCSFLIWNILVSFIIIQFAKGVLNNCELE